MKSQNLQKINLNELAEINGGGGFFDKWGKLSALEEIFDAGHKFAKGFNKGFKKGKPLSSMFN